MQRLTDGWYAISTSSPEAAGLYRRGIDLLVRSSSAARGVLAEAVAADDQLAVALAALACEICPEPAVGAVLDAAARAVLPATRRERQHVEIVVSMLTGAETRARALGAEHLADFPRDALIVHLLARPNVHGFTDQGDPQ